MPNKHNAVLTITIDGSVVHIEGNGLCPYSGRTIVYCRRPKTDCGSCEIFIGHIIGNDQEEEEEDLKH